MISTKLQEVIAFLAELREEQDTSKTFKEKINQVILLLHTDSDMVVEKALFALEELSSLEFSSHYRTRVWDAISLLESIKA